MRLLWRFLLATSIGISVFAAPARAASIVLGQATYDTVTASIRPDAADIGSTANVWMVAVYGGLVFIRGGPAGWAFYGGGGLPVAIPNQVLTASTPVTVVDRLDISSLIGLDLYVGYGRTEWDMFTSPGKLAKIHTVVATNHPPPIQLLVNSPQMPSSGATQIALTAIVLGSAGQTISGRKVSFSTGADTTAFIDNINPVSAVSDANGMVTARLNLGASKANRTITLTATADGATGSSSVEVTGTTVTISGSSSVTFGSTTPLTISVRDSAGAPVQGVAVSVISQAGNSIAQTPAGITDASGQIVAVVTGTRHGDDVITVTAAGATKTQALTTNSPVFAFTTPAAATQIPIASTAQVSITWAENGAPRIGQLVTFTATRGTIFGSPAGTGSEGTTSVSISSASAGPSTITAAGPGGSPVAALNVVFVATSASTVAASAIPGTIHPTVATASQTNNTSTISALVKDAAGNVVANARVAFSISANPSGGSLSANSAVTDISGIASVIYTAGTASSPQNGVSISARVTDVGGVAVSPGVESFATLTVGGQGVFARLATDNVVGVSGASYSKQYFAIVTDSAGTPVPGGTTVRFALRPNRYGKGLFAWSGTSWMQSAPLNAICPNEDVNSNGILDSGEDANGNGKLDPSPGVVSVNATATTDANGFAIATISYAKDYANWIEVMLEARAGTAGSDPPAQATFTLPGQTNDYIVQNIAPPGVVSPFGLGSPATGDNTCASAF